MIPTLDLILKHNLMHEHEEYEVLIHDKGTYPDPAALVAAYPVAQAGDYAIVLSTDTKWIWDGAAWADTGIPAVATKASQVDNDSSVAGDNVKEALDNLSLVPNNIIYVDGSYDTGDSDGTINRPYQTVGDAVAALDAGVIIIAPGAYDEDISLGTATLLMGASPDPEAATLQGDIDGNDIYLRNLTVSGGETFSADGDVQMDNCVLDLPVVISGDARLTDCSFTDALDFAGLVQMDRCRVEVTGGVVAIVQENGELRMTNSTVMGQISGADNYLMVSSEGVLVLDNCRILNDDDNGKAVSMDNGALAPDVNKLLNSTFKGSVDCGAATTNVSNILLYSEITGTDLVYEVAALTPNSVVYVDGTYEGGDSDGTINRPYILIQDALDYLGIGTVMVAPGSYDEDLTFTTMQALVGTSPEPSAVTITGEVDGVDITLRNLTVSGDGLSASGMRTLPSFC